jgi:20S proteasome alpha/beta subunit
MPKPLLPPKNIHLKPKRKRPWRRSKMTIAAGFVCLDGIVLCADTQETITGYTKNSTEKIRLWRDGGLNIAITGAGDTELIETISARVERALYSVYPATGFWPTDRVRDIIQNDMSESFRKYILPYAPFPKDDRPWCELLILVTVSNGVSEYECLFRASGTIVREINLHAECIGSGLILAKSLIERFYHMGMNLDEVVLAACYIMYRTKKWVDGCGGKTDIVISSKKNQFFGGIAGYEIEELERQFEQFEESVNWLMTDLINPNRSLKEVAGVLVRAKESGMRSRKALYGKYERLLDTLKKFAPEHRGRS